MRWGAQFNRYFTSDTTPTTVRQGGSSPMFSLRRRPRAEPSGAIRFARAWLTTTTGSGSWMSSRVRPRPSRTVIPMVVK